MGLTKRSLMVRRLGLQPYNDVYQAMRKFTESRNAKTADELWLLEHRPVFTQGMTDNRAHILSPGEIPVIKSDRGGHVTYHGPGQLTAYALLDLKRRKLGVRQLVSHLENAILRTLMDWQVEGHTRDAAPGVYVENAKIASLGLRIRRGCSYHGLNFNVDMDLSVWQRINACGMNVTMTQLRDVLSTPIKCCDVANRLLHHFCLLLNYEASQTDSVTPSAITANL